MTQLSWGGVHSLAHAPRVDQIMMRENFEIAWRRIVRRISAAFRTAVVCARASSRLALGCVRPGASGSGRGSMLTARLSPLCVLGGVDSKDSHFGESMIQGCFWGGSLGCDGPFGFERRGVGADGAADHRSA